MEYRLASSDRLAAAVSSRLSLRSPSSGTRLASTTRTCVLTMTRMGASAGHDRVVGEHCIGIELDVLGEIELPVYERSHDVAAGRSFDCRAGIQGSPLGLGEVDVRPTHRRPCTPPHTPWAGAR